MGEAVTDPNIDLAVMESRMAGARLSDCASAVSHHGRRRIVAREVQCRRAEVVPAANDDEKQADDKLTAELRGLNSPSSGRPGAKD